MCAVGPDDFDAKILMHLCVAFFVDFFYDDGINLILSNKTTAAFFFYCPSPTAMKRVVGRQPLLFGHQTTAAVVCSGGLSANTALNVR